MWYLRRFNSVCLLLRALCVPKERCVYQKITTSNLRSKLPKHPQVWESSTPFFKNVFALPASFLWYYICCSTKKKKLEGSNGMRDCRTKPLKKVGANVFSTFGPWMVRSPNSVNDWTDFKCLCFPSLIWWITGEKRLMNTWSFFVW